MINKIYTEALLSGAAYADWSKQGTDSEFEIKNELINNRGFTEELYKTFFDPINGTYEVVENGFGYLQNIYGFSGTVFKNRNTGELTVAFRGTEPSDLRDWATDIALALGLTSIQDFLGFGQGESIEILFENAGLTDSSGQSLVAANSVNFTGHSLGGHLALMAMLKFPGIVNDVSTFNGAGIKGWDEIWNSYIAGSTDGAVLNPNITSVNTYFADKGIELTANDIWFTQPGDRDKIFIEYNGALDNVTAANHSIAKIVQSLSVYRVLSVIDPLLDSNSGLSIMYDILDAVSNEAEQSLETIIDVLGDLLGGDLAVQSNKEDIELFYQETTAYMTGLGGTLNIVNVSSLTPSSHLNNADGFAYRYALVNLNPFAITGNVNLYSQHNAGGELDIDKFTDQYLQDRADMLAVKNEFFAQDKTAEFNADVEADTLYKDLTTGLDLRQTIGLSALDIDREQVLFGGDASETGFELKGGRKNDHIYGGEGNDKILGQGGNDYLEGNQGIDTLYGNEGFDTLIGGAGNDNLHGGASGDHADILDGGQGHDIYHIETSDGDTIIRDSDLNGEIKYDGITLGSNNIKAVVDGSNIYQDDDKNKYTFTANDLIITLKNGQRIVIENYTEADQGKLGLNFGNADTVAPPPVTSVSVVGDYEWKDFDLDTAGIQPHLDGLGNEIQDFDKPQDMRDTLNGSGGFDTISSGAENDTVHARGGNDLIFGGQGIDILYGEAGDDHIRGDEGSDILYGGAGEDILHADDIQSLAIALAANNNRNARGSLLSGGADDDILVGNNGQDTLLGGAGKDILIGSAGDDNLIGDDQLTSASIDWNLRREVNQNIYTRHFEQSSFIESVDGDDDTLFGGEGNDWLFGQLGNDMLDGGTGEDILFGGQGNDTLSGGDDDDILTGDSASLADYLHGNDLLDGGQGEDTLFGGGGSDFLYGGLNNDRLFGDGSNIDGNYQGNDYLEGGEGDDELVGGGKADRLYGGQGNDKLFGDSSDLDKQYHGDDILFGGQGDDELTGHGGNDMLDGGADDDIMVGDGGNISLADGGNDILYGRDGEDNISGNGGDDTLYGGADNDQLFGDNGSNASDGGNDSLYGGSGRDILKGDGGNDSLTGGTGTDTLYGGQGDDTFIFQSGDGVDTIRDYDNGDKIQLNGINASAIKARQAAGHDGSYLAIDYTASDTVFIKNGLSMPLDVQLANGQFDLQALLDKGLDYRGTNNADTVTIETAGANTLATFAGDDTLIDNSSDNQLQGGQGNDTYVFGLNNGQDVILDASGSDTIQFEEGIGVDDIKFIKSGSHLALSTEYYWYN